MIFPDDFTDEERKLGPDERRADQFTEPPDQAVWHWDHCPIDVEPDEKYTGCEDCPGWGMDCAAVWKRNGAGVVELDQHRPHTFSPTRCGECSHIWVAVVPEEVFRECTQLECPRCRKMAGLQRKMKFFSSEELAARASDVLDAATLDGIAVVLGDDGEVDLIVTVQKRELKLDDL